MSKKVGVFNTFVAQPQEPQYPLITLALIKDLYEGEIYMRIVLQWLLVGLIEQSGWSR